MENKGKPLLLAIFAVAFVASLVVFDLLTKTSEWRIADHYYSALYRAEKDYDLPGKLKYTVNKQEKLFFQEGLHWAECGAVWEVYMKYDLYLYSTYRSHTYSASSPTREIVQLIVDHWDHCTDSDN